MDLETIGLTEMESKAYEAILKLEEATASEISNSSDVPYGRIYEVLESLVSKGLVRVAPERPKKYSVSNPSNLKEMIEDKKQELNDLEEKVEGLRQTYESAPERSVWVTKGKKAFHKVVQELPDPEEYEYNIKYTSQFHPVWARETGEAVEKGVDFKILTRYDEETEEDVAKWLDITEDIREIENEGVAMAIIDDEVLFLGLIKSETSLVIRDKPLIKMIKNLFLSKWEKSDEIEV